MLLLLLQLGESPVITVTSQPGKEKSLGGGWSGSLARTRSIRLQTITLPWQLKMQFTLMLSLLLGSLTEAMKLPGCIAEQADNEDTDSPPHLQTT